MGLFSIFVTTAEKDLARRLVDHIVKNLPPKIMDQRRQILSANKVSRILEQAFESAKEHQTKTHMGFIKRAVLANEFKWNLRERGYPDDFINLATEGLVVELSRRNRLKQTNDT